MQRQASGSPRSTSPPAKRATTGQKSGLAPARSWAVLGMRVPEGLLFPSSPPAPQVLFSLRKEGEDGKGPEELRFGVVLSVWQGRDLGAPERARLGEEAQAGGSGLSRLRLPTGLRRRGGARTACPTAGAPRSGPVPPRGPRGNGAAARHTVGPRPPGRAALPPPARGGSDPAVTAVRAAAAASPPLPLRGSRRRGRTEAAAPTRVVDVQLVRDALVAPAKDDHQLPDGHGPVSVPGAGDRPREGGNPPPVEEAGSRHLPNPRPSAHNTPRPLGRRRSRGRAGPRLQLCAGAGGGGGGKVTWPRRPGQGWRPRGSPAPTSGRCDRPGPPGQWVLGWKDIAYPPSLPCPLRGPRFVFAREGAAFSFRDALIEHLGCAGESDPGNNDDADGEKPVWRLGVPERGDGRAPGTAASGGRQTREGGRLDHSTPRRLWLGTPHGRSQLSLQRHIRQIRFWGGRARPRSLGTVSREGFSVLFCLSRWKIIYRFLFYC